MLKISISWKNDGFASVFVFVGLSKPKRHVFQSYFLCICYPIVWTEPCGQLQRENVCACKCHIRAMSAFGICLFILFRIFLFLLYFYLFSFLRTDFSCSDIVISRLGDAYHTNDYGHHWQKWQIWIMWNSRTRNSLLLFKNLLFHVTSNICFVYKPLQCFLLFPHFLCSFSLTLLYLSCYWSHSMIVTKTLSKHAHLCACFALNLFISSENIRYEKQLVNTIDN